MIGLAVSRDAFDVLKARYAVAMIIIAIYWQPGIRLAQNAIFRPEWFWPLLVFHYYVHLAIALFLVAAVYFSRLDTRRVLGRAPRWKDIPTIFLFVVFTLSSSFVINLVIVPISYLHPEFVAWWLRWFFEPVVLLSGDGTFPVGANLLSLVSLVVLAPLLEEFLFRGYLLHRLTKKWGLKFGVVLSSVLFGAIHSDPLAAAISGAAFAVIYLKTQSIWAAVLVHALHNLFVWLWDLVGVMSKGLDYYWYTLEQFRSDWWHGAIALLILLLLVDRVLRRKGDLGPFLLPKPNG